MIEVFTTDIQNRNQAADVLKVLEYEFPDLRINFDLSDSGSSLFPCSHLILRAEGLNVNPEGIISVVNKTGFLCNVLEDKVCS